MRIMLVTMDYPPPMGGIQVVTKNLEEDLVANGHAVCLINVDGRNNSSYRRLRMRDFLTTPATRRPYFHPRDYFNPVKLLKRGGLRDFIFNNMLYRLANDARSHFRPDVTHIMKPTLYAAVYGCLEPFLVSCHGEEIQDTLAVGYALRNAKSIHCVSNYTSGLVSSIPGVEGMSRVVIYNSVKLEPMQQDTPTENLVISCCRLVKRKNIDSVLRAFALLQANLAEEYRYVIIGGGAEEASLRTLAQALELKNALFLGEISDAEKLRWLHRSRLFVLCPKPHSEEYEANEEGFGISFIEAQAAGLPVIASRIGGIPEAVGEGGLLVENPTDPGEIASKMQLVLENGALYDELKRNIRNRIHQFDRTTTFKAFEKLYADTVNIT